jgi:hypothetical protein
MQVGDDHRNAGIKRPQAHGFSSARAFSIGILASLMAHVVQVMAQACV